MNWNALGRGSAAALLLLTLAPLGAGATPATTLSRSEGRANPSAVAQEKAQGLALGFRAADEIARDDDADRDRGTNGNGFGNGLGLGGNDFVPPRADVGGAPAAVPEPSAALLFAGGLLVAGATRRIWMR